MIVEIFTDGSCYPNPGPGGWGAILRYGTIEKEISGSEPATTNNRMEMTAAIKALEILKRPCQVTLYTDSQYLQLGIIKHIRSSKLLGWRPAADLKNRDLWSELIALTSIHDTTWIWVRGHSGHVENERADRLALAARISGTSS